MSKIVQTEVFKFDELTDEAKESARQWFREASAGDDFWSEYVIDDAKQIGAYLGFDIQDIYWSGFSSQGDGACIVGTWSANRVKAAALRAHAPRDKELAQIRKAMRAFARKHKENWASIKHRGYYYHEQYTDISAEHGEDTFAEVARDFMQWIYRALEREYEFQNSNKQVDENIRCNEYEFTTEGKRA